MIIFKGFKLDDSIGFDDEVDLAWYCSDVKNVFCCNFMGYTPSVKNLRSDVYELYTLTDRWTETMRIDVSVVTIASNGLNIVDDFLALVKKQLINTDEYLKFIGRYDEIRSYLYYRFRTNWDMNLASLFKIFDIYDRTCSANIICSNLLERMFISVPERFESISLDEVIELPFIEGDCFYVIYTIKYLNITKRYRINIYLV
jgi:hypothetical protein